MKSITTIGLDIAKQVFQVHEADKASRVVLRQKLRRNEVCAPFLSWSGVSQASKPADLRVGATIDHVAP